MINAAKPWVALLNPTRRKKDSEDLSSLASKASNSTTTEVRTEIERDYDRILFSTPVRRLADKTQVFPLDKNDSVRTRLTHSHEVSNLARSFGTALCFKYQIANDVEDAQRNIPSLLAAIGLVHDLGNPPFGHQGEAAIQSWFKDNEKQVLDGVKGKLSKQQKQDFLRFEGNAQGFRLVTRLQLLNDDFGLDLTYATLSAMMKYPVGSHQVKQGDESTAASKKHGYFAAEQEIAERVMQKAGLAVGKRHPLAYVMEACDDIAYVVLDAEDAVKKGLASFSDLISHLYPHREDDIVNRVYDQSLEKHDEYRQLASPLSPAELNDVSMQRFRVFAIGAMISAATDAFTQNKDVLTRGESALGLMALSKAEKLRGLLKNFAFKHAYSHKSVLKLELQGYNVIRDLMNIFWAAIVDYDNPQNADVLPRDFKRSRPFTKYVYGRISENYRRIFENPTDAVKKLPLRYRECLLLTDMISGMTDSFAMDLHQELIALKGDFDMTTVLVKK